MSSRNRKRKLAQDDSSRPPRRQPRSAPRPSAVAAEPPQTDFDFHIDPNAGHGGSDRPAGYNPALYIQAYEADVVRGPQAWTNARALEVRTVAGDDLGATAGGVAPGEGLIRWRGANIDDGADEIWVDRYVVSLNSNGYASCLRSRWSVIATGDLLAAEIIDYSILFASEPSLTFPRQI